MSGEKKRNSRHRPRRRSGGGGKPNGGSGGVTVMRKFNGLLLVSDFDNTLVYTEEALQKVRGYAPRL